MATAAVGGRETAGATITKKKISLRIRNRQQKIICRCSMCRKKLKFTGTNEYPFTRWKCMIVNTDS